MNIRILKGDKMTSKIDESTLATHGYMLRAMAVGTVITVRDSIRPEKEYAGRLLTSHVYHVMKREGRKIYALGYDERLDEFLYCVMIDKKPVWLSCGIVKKKKEKLIRFADIGDNDE